MSRQLEAIMLRRGELIARCAAQRSALGESADGLARPIALIDRGWSAARYLKAHPVVLLGGVIGLAFARRHDLFPLLRRGFTLWQASAAVRRFLGLSPR